MRGMVLYTDGGCRPNPGFGGYGVHGYRYADTGKATAKPKRYHFTVSGYKETTDNPVYPIEYYDIAGSLSDTSTNTESEIVAVVKALELARDHIDDIERLDIHVDNQFVYSVVSQMLGIETDEPPITVKTHTDRWDRIKMLLSDMTPNLSINIYKVNSHSNDLGNDLADTLATIGLNIGLTYHEYDKIVSCVSPPSGYWKPVNQVPNILRHKFLFYHTTDPVPVSVYLTMDYDKDAPIGRAIRTATYIATKTSSVSILDTILSQQKHISHGYGRYYVVLLTNLSPTIQKHYERFGKYIFTVSETDDGPILSYLFKTPITKALSPIGLSHYIADIYKMVVEPLFQYLENTDNHYTYVDITDQVTDNEWLSKATDIRRTIKTQSGTYRVFAGFSLPDKTILKRLPTTSKYYLVLMKDRRIPNRFFILVETDTFTSIWLNYPTSLVLYQD